ncbi:spermidine synthase [Pseudomonas duriflava]|uniref:Spermidine synthase n=1 Tax=Pseudomonas duriflava TaxID=459528 RepID=A0A562Q4R2_9PSED|nr:spermidine synthase [Pseudomonas duriflava]TWI51006.1 spermidine synthase [Pseudomonas duriflava]
MDTAERLLAEIHDEHGRIRVVEVGEYRFLEFGDEVEQSCVSTKDPGWLEYDYGRAMLLGALCPSAPECALFLGLGAGTLTRACLDWLPLTSVEAIELREAVPQLARDHFGLGDDPRLHIRIGDAVDLLETCEPADVIFVDLYTDVGPSAAHLAWGFLTSCQRKLKPGGWLIINQWTSTDNKPLGAAFLRGMFRHHYWECPVPEGNVIIFVPSSLEEELDKEALRNRARVLETRLGYSLQTYIDLLRPAT